jgi:hemoglobin/transferrin/lactoferrin receptor protein
MYGEDNFKYATQYGTPAWCTLNATVTIRPLKALDITIGVENITDVNYRVFASGISAPGRNLILKLSGWF